MARAFRAASGDLIWQPIGYPAAPTHPPYAIGTRGPLGDQNTSIEASFYFPVQILYSKIIIFQKSIEIIYIIYIAIIIIQLLTFKSL